MISIDVTLFIQMANFFVFLLLMNAVLYRPVRRLVAQRNQHISDQQESIEQADAEALAAVREFEDSIQRARQAGRQKAQEMKEAAYQMEKELVERATEQGAKQVHEMRLKIQADIGAAREQLKSQVQAFAREVAQKILGRSV